tara:strand:+ start:387 stop:596 length:210 start_codon:yes stop_codon:yes gene_type:complete
MIDYRNGAQFENSSRRYTENSRRFYNSELNGNNLDDIDANENGGGCYCLPCCKSKDEKNKEEMFYLSEL